MERITKPDGNYTSFAKAKLKAYEDTGLDPQDVLNARDLVKIACALRELNQYKELGDLDRLKELVEADKAWQHNLESMANLERRAMLGDRQAQEECTAKQILLPCPFCGCRMRLLEGDSYFGSHLVKCVWCGAGTREVGNKYVAIYLANRRPAPPIGRCKDCIHYFQSECLKIYDDGPEASPAP